MRKVIVLGAIAEGESGDIALLKKIPGITVVTGPASGEDAIIEAAKDAEVVLFSAAQITAKVIDGLENCKMIMRYGIGYDSVDIQRAAERGIYVCNAPKYGVIDVAEHALSLLLALAKNTVGMDQRARDGKWGPNPGEQFLRLAGRTIGFVGFGNIGRAFCKMTNALGMKAVAYDPFAKPEVFAEYGAESLSMEEVLAKADVVSLHLPLNEKTRHTFDKEMFRKMKPSAVLINTSRGGVIHEQEMIEVLEEGIIAGAGLDVFEDETNPLDTRLTGLPNVVLTPHVAWNTDLAVDALYEEVADNVARYIRGERPESIVNGL